MLSDWLETRTLPLLALYLRRSRLEKGRWRLTQYVLPRTSRLAPRLGRRVVRTRHGFRMDLDLSDFICQVVWATGEFEQHTTHLIRALLAPGDAVVDVGANVGYFTLLAAGAVGAAGRVDAFEPVPDVYTDLARNVRLNKLGQVVIHEEALWDCEGEATIWLGPAHEKGTSALRPFDGQAGQLTIRTTRLDQYLAELPPVRLIKIDVEGAEYRVLQGMDGCLRRDRPDLIVELCDEYLTALGASAAAVCELLRKHGYQMYGMDYDGLVPMTGWSPAAPSLFNGFFTQRERLPVGVVVKHEWHSSH